MLTEAPKRITGGFTLNIHPKFGITVRHIIEFVDPNMTGIRPILIIEGCSNRNECTVVGHAQPN